MRRFFIIISICVTLLSNTILLVNASSSTSKEIFNELNSNFQHVQQSGPIVEYHKDSGKILLLIPINERTRYVLNHASEYEKMNAYVTVDMQIDIRFDEQEWTQPQLDANTSILLPFTHTVAIENYTDNQMIVELIDLNQYAPENDTLKIFTSIIEQQSPPVIDFSKHTLYVKCQDRYTCTINGTTSFATFGEGQEVQYNHNDTQLTQSMSPPVMSNVIINTADNKLLINMTESTDTTWLNTMKHHAALQIRFVKISTSTTEDGIPQESLTYYDCIEVPIYTNKNVVIPVVIPQLDDDNEILNVEFSLINYTLNDESDWMRVAPTIKTTPGFDEEVDEHINTNNKKNTCNLCGTCTWHPANICMWMWIGMIVFGIISMVTAIWLTCVIIKQRKVKED